MFAIFQREFKALLRNIKALVCIVLYIIASAILFLANNVTMGYPYMHSVFSSMSLVAAVLIIPVAAMVITSEKKKGGDAFLSVLSVTTADIVLGKALAVFCLFLIPAAVLAIYPIVLIAIGGGGFLQAYVMLIMLLFVQAFIIALGVLCSACCRKSWLALLIAYIVLIVLFGLGMISVIFGGWVEDILRFISPFRHFDPIVFDLFDISSLLFYSSFSAVLLYFAIKRYKVRGTKKAKAGLTVKVLSAVLIAVILFANIGISLFPGIFRQFDISTNRIYAISGDTKNYLDKLDDEITVYLIDPSNVEQKLYNYVYRYCESSSKITLKEIDTTKDTEFLAKYKQTYLPLYSMIVESKKTGRYKILTSDEYFVYVHPEVGQMSPSVYNQMIQQYGELYEYYRTLYSSDQVSAEDLSKVEEYLYSLMTESVLSLQAEKAMTSAIEYVNAPYIPGYYFLSAHGETNMGSSTIETKALEKMSVEEARLTMVIINAPKEDYTADDIAAIQGFSEKGGKLLFITDENVKDMPNIQKLLLCFGLSTEEGVITVDGSTNVTAITNTTNSVIQDASYAMLKMTGASSIITQQVGGLKHSPLASVTVSTPAANEGEEPVKVEKTVAVAVSEGEGEAESPKAIWLTGAPTFNADTTGMTDEQKKDVKNSLTLMQMSILWLWSDFPYTINISNVKTYSPLAISVSDGDGIWFGTVFIGLVPIVVCTLAYLNIYSRKKRSRAVKIVED